MRIFKFLTAIAIIMGGMAFSASATTYTASCPTSGNDTYYYITADQTSGCEITGLTATGWIIIDCQGHKFSGVVPFSPGGYTLWIHNKGITLYNCETNNSGNSTTLVYWDCNGGTGWIAGSNFIFSGSAPGFILMDNCASGHLATGPNSANKIQIINGSLAYTSGVPNVAIRYANIDMSGITNPAVVNAISFSSMSSFEVSSSTLKGYGTGSDDGISFSDVTSSALIQNNNISGFDDYSIEGSSSGSTGVSQNVTIKSNTLGDRGISCFNQCVGTIDGWVIDSNDITITANTLPFWFQGSNTGILKNLDVKNNVVHNNSGLSTIYSQFGGPSGGSKFWSASNNTFTNNDWGGSNMVFNTSGMIDGGSNIHRTSVSPWYAMYCLP